MRKGVRKKDRAVGEALKETQKVRRGEGSREEE